VVTRAADGRSAGATYSARAVLVTVPLGVLQQSLNVRGHLLPRVEGAATLEFRPPLSPVHVSAISRLGMGLLQKVIVEWDVGVVLGSLPGKVEALEYVDGSHFMPEVLVLRHFSPQHNALILFSSGSRALQASRMSDADARDAVMAQLRRMLGESLPEPRRFTRTMWEADPFSCGSYSFLPPGVSGAERDALARSEDGVLWFGGEHCAGDYPSTVHGAMLSGRRAASSISRALGSSA
jgi:monoamine oxidase